MTSSKEQLAVPSSCKEATCCLRPTQGGACSSVLLERPQLAEEEGAASAATDGRPGKAEFQREVASATERFFISWRVRWRGTA